jgi:hypothetical protein
MYWTPSQKGGSNGLDRVREAAKKDGKILHPYPTERFDAKHPR